MTLALTAAEALWFLPFVLPICIWVAWSDLREMRIPNVSVLALAGTARTKLPSGETRDISMVQFYLPTGQHLNQLKVPGSGIR